MNAKRLLVEMPTDLDLRWGSRERQTFKGAEEAWRLWHEWIASHDITPEQVYRKLLLDIFYDYRRAYHLGSEFDTDDPVYEEFNRCTAAPIRSMDDYVDRIAALLDYEMSHQPSTAGQLAQMKISFIVAGEPGSDLEAALRKNAVPDK